MISPDVHAAIERWVKVDTWHKGHPLDDERFYAMLAVIDSEGARNFAVEEFSDVASELVERHHPNMKREFVSQNVREKALQAEAIMSYVAFRERSQI